MDPLDARSGAPFFVLIQEGFPMTPNQSMGGGSQKCAHPGCKCTVDGSKKFCSAQCESLGMKEGAGGKCGCGHPGCT